MHGTVLYLIVLKVQLELICFLYCASTSLDMFRLSGCLLFQVLTRLAHEKHFPTAGTHELVGLTREQGFKVYTIVASAESPVS